MVAANFITMAQIFAEFCEHLSLKANKLINLHVFEKYWKVCGIPYNSHLLAKICKIFIFNKSFNLYAFPKQLFLQPLTYKWKFA